MLAPIVSHRGRGEVCRRRYGERVRHATLADAPAVRTLLAHALADDPLMRWMFPVDAARTESVAAWLGIYVDRYLSAASVPSAVLGGTTIVEDDAGEVVAAAVWRWPTDDLSAGGPPAGSLPTTTGLLMALVGADHATEVASAMAAAARDRPTDPTAYLHFLAVAGSVRRRGLARALVRDGVERATADGLPVLLQTTRPANVEVYRRLGFAVRATATLGAGGPTLVTMSTTAPGSVRA